LTLGKGFVLEGAANDFRNPMFAFIVFVNSGDVSRKELLREYAKAPGPFIPNAVCFLNGSAINKAKLRGEQPVMVTSIKSKRHGRVGPAATNAQFRV
jgi:hypothetical protein